MPFTQASCRNRQTGNKSEEGNTQIPLIQSRLKPVYKYTSANARAKPDTRSQTLALLQLALALPAVSRAAYAYYII